MTEMRCLLLILSVFALTAQAQEAEVDQSLPWQQVWQEVMSADEMEDEDWEENYERLAQLTEQPLDLNQMTVAEMEQLPFLSAQQVEDIVEYLDRYGPMRSMNELKMIKSLDYHQLALLPFFVYVGEVPRQEERHFPKLKTILRYGEHQLTATGRLPFYERKGDKGAYLGYRYRHSLRYEFHYGNYVKAGLTGSQDAGEPFLAGRNRWGYDAWNYYVLVQKLGRVESAVVGKYKVATGMGLVLNTSFSPGKMATLQSLGRSTRTLRAHGSRSEADYFQGAAATLRLSRPLSLTAFVSYRPIDATLNADGTAATLLTSGYHRTETEMEKKYNTHLTATGASLHLHRGGLQLGANAVYTHIDRSLEPNRQTLYRRHNAHGSDFVNVSANYAYTHYRFALNGETAADKSGAIATINSLSLQLPQSVSLMLLQRFYSYRYSSLYARSFGENSRVQNESGFFVGVGWHPLPHLQLDAYADYAYFPWARYQVSATSHATDFLLQAVYKRKHWVLTARGRVHLKQKDNAEKTGLTADNDYRGRLSVAYTSAAGWSAKTQIDLARTFYEKAELGKMITEQLTWKNKRCQLFLSASLFDTDSYDTRLYAYVRQLAHDFYFPTYWGQGVHLTLQGNIDIGKNLQLGAHLDYTNYFDRPVIGTGQQQIDQSHQTNLSLQARWRF
ncbi:MAG: helix-hairpin-helix domain-containing protein [Prevotella sp.]|nr:helix-hairpin-helix domain-containing protein [Prevotella sp.]